MSIQRARNHLTHLTQQLGVAQERASASALRVAQVESDLRQAEAEFHLAQDLTELLDYCLQTTTHSNLKQIADLVNQTLATIFTDQQIEFSFKVDALKTTTTITPYVKAGPAEGSTDDLGGGILAPIALILKIISAIYLRATQIVALDESLSFISAEYIERTALALEQLAIKLNTPILLITHQPRFASHATLHYEISQEDTTRGSVVRLISDRRKTTAGEQTNIQALSKETIPT